ncbi:MAG: hypothetical protein LBD72_01620 [Puniceicoccales bacterium]|jgi:protein arginine kinase activator|nr:hypothetical protein [Puniceicoccales bacterium]
MKDLARCDCCGAPATVFLTQIINGVATHLCLCDKCARARGFTDVAGRPSKGLAGFWDFRTSVAADKNVDFACPKCGMITAKLCATSRVGCAQCYTTFRNIIFERISSNKEKTKFAGKIPTLLPKSSNADLQSPLCPPKEERSSKPAIDGHVRKLFSYLRLAILEERYEDAAQIRDEIVACGKKKYGRVPARSQKNA